MASHELIRAVGEDAARFFKSKEVMYSMDDKAFFKACGWLDELTQPILAVEEIINIARGRQCFIRLKKVIRFGDNVFEDKPEDLIYLSHYKTGFYILSKEFEPLDIFSTKEEMLRKMSGYLRSYFP